MRMAVWLAAALLAASAPAAAQGPIETSGTVTHRRADAHFPERIGEFPRQSANQFDESGNDISASYWLVRGDERLLVTVYIYPSGPMGNADARERQCEAEFDGVGAAIVQNNGSARLADESEPPAVAGVAPAHAQPSD